MVRTGRKTQEKPAHYGKNRDARGVEYPTDGDAQVEILLVESAMLEVGDCVGRMRGRVVDPESRSWVELNS